MAPPKSSLRSLGLGGLIALYGNAFAVVDALTSLSLGGTVGGAGLGVLSVVLARRDGRDWPRRLGLGWRGLGTSLLAGLGLGILLGLPGAVYFLNPGLAPLPVQHQAVLAVDQSTLLLLMLVKIPFLTALAEELAFRGLLLERMLLSFGPRVAVLLNALVFTAWHVVVSFTTLQGTNLAADPGLSALAYAGQNASVFVAGLVWALLRIRTGNLAGCIVAHAVTDLLLLGGMYAGRG